jgi:hypothetical protein
MEVPFEPRVSITARTLLVSDASIFRTEIDAEARMGFVLAHISAEVAE